MPNNNSSLYGTTSNVTVSANNLTTLYNATGGNVKSVAVPDRNLTTLYPSAVTEVNPTKSYGNANVARFLDNGTDGANTITNIIASNNITAGGNITADYYFGNGAFLSGIGNSNYATNANFANFAGNVVLGDQPNITSVGNLINLTIVGQTNLGAVANVHISGGSANYALITDGTGNLSWGSVDTAANANFANYANFANFSNSASFSNVANVANSVAGSNVVGDVAGANHANIADVANSVSVANVVGIGNIATINLDGNVSNVLHGNGLWSPIIIPTGDHISNGTSNVNIPVANGNVLFAVNGVSNVMVVSDTNVNIPNPIVTPNTVIIGNTAGNTSYANTRGDVSIGYQAGKGTHTSDPTVAVGYQAGNIGQKQGAIAIGFTSGQDQGNAALAIGSGAGKTSQGNYTIALGYQAGALNQAEYGIAIGLNSGSTNQGDNAIGIGYNAGVNSQGSRAIAIGRDTAGIGQGYGAVAIGSRAGYGASQANSVAIGFNAGEGGVGANAIVIGSTITLSNQNAITFNATGSALSDSGANTFTVKPVRQANTANMMFYNATSGEITYDVLLTPNSVANSNYANYAGNAFSVSGSNVVGNVANADFANLAYNVNVTLANSSVTTYNLTMVDWIAGGQHIHADAFDLQFNANTHTLNTVNISATGNITANYFIGNGSQLTDINGSNVSNVANANYANYAGNAFSVSGSNVVGDVSGANHANIADVANSVSVANVVGIGNIATINLDGNVSNILHGNGFWGPELSNGNANYANFAGNLINGNSNVTVVANSNVNMSVGGNANVFTVNGNGTVTLTPPTGGFNNAITINNYGRSGGQGASRIASFRYRGNTTANLSVQPNDNVMEIIPIAYNGTALSTTVIPNFRAVVDSSYVANAANVPIGWQLQVATPSNTQATHNFYANGNISFANSVSVNNELAVSGNANITANITSVSGVFNGNGSGLTSLTGANVTGQVAFANMANYAGNITISAQPNITSTGNLANLIVNSGNANLPIYQIQPSHNVLVGNTANLTLSPYAYIVTQDYGNGQNDGNLALPGNESFVRARGNSTTPTAVAQNDRINKSSYYGYNGTANILAVTTDTRIANTNANANAVWSGGSYNITTGNPLGDVGNSNAQSAFNSFAFDQYGRLILSPGTNPTGVTNGGILVNNYGGTALNSTQALVFNRYRGNRDANTSVVAGDQLGGMTFVGYNGTALATNRVAQVRAQVQSSYTTGNANIPLYLNFLSCNDTTQFQTTINADNNGGFVNPGNLSAINGNFVVSNTSGATTVYFSGDKTTNSGFNLFDTQFSVTMSNVNTTTGFSPFRFQQYAPSSNEFGSWYMYRARGTSFATSAPVVAGDKIFEFNFITNSNNTTTSVGSFSSSVTYNDNAGNVGGNISLNVVGTGTVGAQNGSVDINAANTNINGNLNVSNNIVYTRVYGQFQYNSSVSPVAANTAYVFPLGTTDISNIVTVASTSHLIPGAAGKFNLQFSIQVDNADNANDHTAYIWLRKNGTDVTGSMGRVTIPKNNAGSLKIIAWNYLIDSSNTTDYWELAYAASDTNITFPAYGATAFGPSTACIITSLVPVGA